MKVINKSYKIRIYPNKEQKILLEKHFGCVRFVYNHFLNKRNVEYKENKVNISYYETANELSVLKTKEDFVFLNEINSQSLQWSLRFLDIAFRNFFRGQTKFPNFKKKSNNQSFKVPVNSTFKLEENKLIIPKFREGINFRGNLELENLVKFNSVNISRTPSGKYYASLQGEFNYIPKKRNDNKVGIDLGIKDFLITDSGVRIGNPKFLKKQLKKLKFNQKQLSKKIKGSNNRQKRRKIVSLIHEKITNKRMDFLHKLSSKIVNENQVICLESLMVKNIIN
jgi:putative transposase